MIVYRDAEREVTPAVVIRHLRGVAGRTDAIGDASLGVLIALGELESALADREGADADDGPSPQLARTHDATCAAAAWWLHHAHPMEAPARAALARALDELETEDWPASLRVRTAEGFAFYALDPHGYVRHTMEIARRRPARLLVLGLRSIGTVLAAIVHACAARLRIPVTSFTIRPRGHPFDRRPIFGRGLAACCAPFRGGEVIVVDEGPGLSGSSIAGTIAALEGLGWRADRVHVLTGHLPDPDRLLNAGARERFRTATVRAAGTLPAPSSRPADVGEPELVAPGAWREWRLPGPEPYTAAEWPPSHAQHERRKWRAPFAGITAIGRFAGFGEVGLSRLVRASRLAAAHFAPPPMALQAGVLWSPFVSGDPLERGRVSADDVDRIADYLAWRGRHFTTGQETDVWRLADMVTTNVRALVEGRARPERWWRLLDPVRLGSRPAVVPDGRLQPWEWLRPRDRGPLLKLDAIDHGDDHFWPGPQDPVWDLAGACIELGLDAEGRGALVERYRSRARDCQASALLPAYLVAYAASRCAYLTVCRDTTEGDERQRFDRELQHGRAELFRSLHA
ncbi:MAG TPA: hypothetical protein VIL35_12950 [Vicinamibacterales bacterium]